MNRLPPVQRGVCLALAVLVAACGGGDGGGSSPFGSSEAASTDATNVGDDTSLSTSLSEETGSSSEPGADTGASSSTAGSEEGSSTGNEPPSSCEAAITACDETTEIASDQTAPRGFTIAEGSVYWINAGAGSNVWRVSGGGEDAEQLDLGIPSDEYLVGYAQLEGIGYLSFYSGVQRIEPDGSLALVNGALSSPSIESDGERIFLNGHNQEQVVAMTPDEEFDTLATQTRFFFDFTVGDSYVFGFHTFTFAPADIARLSKDGGEVELLTQSSNPGRLVAVGDDIFATNTEPGEIVRITADGTIDTVAEFDRRPFALAAVGTDLYVTLDLPDADIDAEIYLLPGGEGPPQLVLSTQAERINDLIVDGDRLLLSYSGEDDPLVAHGAVVATPRCGC